MCVVLLFLLPHLAYEKMSVFAFFGHFKVKFCYIYLPNTQKDKTKSTLINKMLYFLSKVKMEEAK